MNAHASSNQKLNNNFSLHWQETQDYPWRHGFIPLLREIGAHHPDLPAIGQSQRPQQEVFRIGQQASLAFAPREIASLNLSNNKVNISLFGLGMLGPNGPLPTHYTEFIRERVETFHDHTLANFLDLFHHRAISHYYRAWFQSQSTAGLDRPNEETFTPYIARLAGDEPLEAQAVSALPPHARWASSAHRIRQSRNPDGLVSTLSRYFGVKVTLEEYALHWIKIASDDRCYLGYPGLAATLGQGSLLGEMIADRQGKFCLIIGPLTFEQYLNFTPQGTAKNSAMYALVEWVRAFIGLEYEWEVRLLIKSEEVTPVTLGESQQLGWTSWIGEQAINLPVTGMIFSPETYLRTKKDV